MLAQTEHGEREAKTRAGPIPSTQRLVQRDSNKKIHLPSKQVLNKPSVDTKGVIPSDLKAQAPS